MNDKFLGYLNVPKVNNLTSNDDLVSVLRDLQAQGAQLLKHAFRPKEYLIVCVGSFELPTLTYTLDCNSRRFNKRVTKRFRALLASTKPQRVTLSWDEDDTKALKSIVTSWSMSPGRLKIQLGRANHEKLRVLAWTTNQPKLLLRLKTSQDNLHDLRFLAFFKHVQHLALNSTTMSFSSKVHIIWPTNGSALPPSITKLSLLSASFNEVELDIFENLVSLKVMVTTQRRYK